MPPSNDNHPKKTRLWTPVFIAIVLAALGCFIVGQGTNAGTSVYLAQRGASAALAGIGAAVFSAGAAVVRIICGPLIDQRGRIIVITVGAAVMLCGTLGAAVFPSLDLFVLWRLLQGAGFSAATTAAATAAADVLPVERLGEGIGYYGLGQAVAMSFGPALGIFLVSTDPAENLFWGLSLSAAIVLVISLFCRYERHLDWLPDTATYRRIAIQRDKERKEASTLADDTPDKSANADVAAASGENAPADDAPKPEAPSRMRSFIDSIFEPKALAGALPIMVICPTFAFGIFFTGLLGTTIGVGNAGIFYTVSAITMIAIRLASRSYMDSAPAFALHVFAAIAGVLFCGMLIIACQDGLDKGVRDILYYLAGAPYGLCLGVASPVNQSVSVKNSPAERWGAVNGLFLLSNDIGIGGAAIIWGVTNDQFGFAVTLTCVLVMIVASIGVAWLSYPSAEKHRRTTS